MTKPNFTSISLIVDESGSMSNVYSATIVGINEFIKSQKETPGEAIFSLIKFNNSINTLHEHAPLQLVPYISRDNYIPNGGTALLDAIGITIESLGKKFSEMSEDERPSKVIVAIQTDGQENESVQFTKEHINGMIKHQTEVYNWEFLFLGANQDAIATGMAYGIAAGSAMTYSSSVIGTEESFKTLGKSISRGRTLSAKSTITAEDRTEYESKISSNGGQNNGQPRAANGRFLSKGA